MYRKEHRIYRTCILEIMTSRNKEELLAVLKLSQRKEEKAGHEQAKTNGGSLDL